MMVLTISDYFGILVAVVAAVLLQVKTDSNQSE
jgi:hypothetical protein